MSCRGPEEDSQEQGEKDLWDASVRRKIRNEQRQIINDVHSKLGMQL